MQTDHNTYEGLRAILEKETPILIAQIRALYRELDKKFHLQGAKVPITFGFETDSLGSYNQNGHGQKEHFHFSLFFYDLYSFFTNCSQQPIYSSFSIFSKPKFTAFLRASSSSWLNIT